MKKTDRERNEANDAAIYARLGIELSRSIIPEDNTEYVIMAQYPGTDDFEVLGVGTKSFGIEIAVKMDRDVNLMFM